MQSVSPWLVLLLGRSYISSGSWWPAVGPSLALAPLGGVLADQVDKRRLLILTQSVAALQALALFGLTFTDLVQIWHIMLLALALGFVNALDMPVRQSFAAELVSRDDLMNAITLNAASFNLARVIGPAVAGITLAIFGPAFNFAINAVSYRGAWRPRRWTRGVQPIARPATTLDPHQPVGGSAMRSPRRRCSGRSCCWRGPAPSDELQLLPLFAKYTLSLEADGFSALFAAISRLAPRSLSLSFVGSRRRWYG
jgi:MFS family permease